MHAYTQRRRKVLRGPGKILAIPLTIYYEY